MSAAGILTVLVPAVGGQGGGVLAEWIVDAALGEGLAVQGTSIPGVAQRTGSTSYYVEMCAPPDPGQAPPVFSLYPIPGALDVLLAPELLEVARSIELGFPSPSRTTIIASSHRLYSIHEKIATGGGIYPLVQLQAAAAAFSRSTVVFDALALARQHGTEVNALLLGALAASDALPVGVEAYRRAIQSKGVQVAANLQGFEIGLERARTLASGGAGASGGGQGAVSTAPLAAAPGELAADLARLPEGLRPVAGAALARLVDYQDVRYARRYLDRLRPFTGDGADAELARLVAQYLAVWMTYEDAIRVAQLKTRAERLDRIRTDTRSPGAAIVVTDYLKPDLDEIYGIMPHRLVAPVARWAERRWPRGRPTLGQQVKTTTVSGFLRLWLLARCRRLRPSSYRAYHEHARMERWLAAVQRCAGWDRALAREVARAARLVKGYGQVRRRLEAVLDDLLEGVLRAAELEAATGGDFRIASALAERYRALVLQGPESEPLATGLAAEVVSRLEKGDRAAALAALR